MAEKENQISTLPLLPLKNSVLFPGLLMPLSVGRAGSVAAVEKALATEEKEIIVVTQRDVSVDTPKGADLFTIGTRAVIRKVGRGKEQLELLVFGLERVVIVKVDEEGGYLAARVRTLPA
ncbi:MAG: LON peptidase substrate-binding domain-containing protein, partial [Acidobacteriia bacterium]|nr:LON peptidase substrate-binding domain-containing protein [Terriglobia bacterium]